MSALAAPPVKGMPLVDTSVIVDHLRGHREAGKLLEDLFDREGHVFISVLTKVEILAGMKAAEAAALDDFLDLFVPVPVDDEIARTAGSMASKHRRTDPKLDVIDFMVAAQALRGGFALHTANVERYPFIEDLRKAY